MPDDPLKRISQDFGLTAVVATEIEFYLHGAGAVLGHQQVIDIIRTECDSAGIALFNAETERGPDQYEVSLLPSRDIRKITEDTGRFKNLMAKAFSSFPVQADFSAKPKQDIPGSGLHVHLHLEDAQGRNVFVREDDVFSAPLLHSIAGMLKLMNQHMPVFAPVPESYDRFRFTVNGYLLCSTAANVPLTVSWGTNNRTVAVRLPNKPSDNKHIEHRVAGSDADVAAVIEAILAGVYHGLVNKCDPGNPVYGDASLEQYGLPKLPLSLDEAMAAALASS